MIERFADGRVEFANDQIAKAHRIDEMAFIIDDIELIEGFPVPTDFAQMSKNVADSPTLLNGDIFGSHSAPDRLFGITEQICSYFALFRREQIQQLLGDCRRQFFEQGSAVVGRKVVNNLSDLFVAQGLHELFLVLQAEIFEDLSGELPRQNAQQHRFIVGFEVGKDLGEIRGRKAAKNFAQSSEIALLDQFYQLRLKQIANHGFNQPQLNWMRKGKTLD